MKARISLSALVTVAALALALSAGAANRPGDYTGKPATSGWNADPNVKHPVTHWWTGARVLGPSRADMVIRPHVTTGPTAIRPHATAGWTRASS
jgi:hypothetical protein